MSEKYYTTASVPGPWDAIVIGSGIGGMTTAALLAHVGKRVLVLEQHYVPGGFTHTFRHKDWTWDVGVHAIGQVTEHALVGRVLRLLTDGQLEWASLGDCYDEFYFPDGFRINFPSSVKIFRDTLVESFPDEVAGIDRYLALVREVASSMPGYFAARVSPPTLAAGLHATVGRKMARFFAQKTDDVMAGLTKNERLRTMLTSQWAYYGSPPSRSSFAVQALVAKHYFYGAYYPKGGSARIADTLLGSVVRRGGAVRIRASVASIVVENGRAVGVRLSNGEEIRAPKIVSSVGARATVENLLPETDVTQRWRQGLAPLQQSPAHVCLYIGFKGDIRAAGAGSANKWFYETWDPEVVTWNPQTDVKAPVLYTSFGSLKDPEHNPGPEQLHTGEVITFMPMEVVRQWDGTRWAHRGDAYDALKNDLRHRLLNQFLDHMPKLRPLVAYTELSTPLSTVHFTRAREGAIYGLEPTPERFASPWLAPRSPLKGLYMSGVDAGMVGVIGAMLGGVLAGVAAEPLRAMRLLSPVMKRA